ncbi:MAG: DNA repair protein RecO [Betaproteobacteria bacterium]|nr:DNA repair protein RecO [Betaproteobacteria bacterium]
MKATAGDSSAGFVLHTYPYRETSLIVEAFTRGHGRITFVARGAKRPRGAMRGSLHPFQGLHFSWFGRAEMKTLKEVEHEIIFPQMAGDALLSAFYLNELLMKLTVREDAHEQLFDAYHDALQGLSGRDASPVGDVPQILRRFEIVFLREIGYALHLTEEADSHAPIEPGQRYIYIMERGPIAAQQLKNDPRWRDEPTVLGKTLLDMDRGEWLDANSQQQAKALMRRVINRLLGDKPLHTRQLMRELR